MSPKTCHPRTHTPPSARQRTRQYAQMNYPCSRVLIYFSLVFGTSEVLESSPPFFSAPMRTKTRKKQLVFLSHPLFRGVRGLVLERFPSLSTAPPATAGANLRLPLWTAHPERFMRRAIAGRSSRFFVTSAAFSPPGILAIAMRPERTTS